MSEKHDVLMDHFMNPRNVGEMADADGLGEVANTICGLLQSREEFNSEFGSLVQTPPVGLLEGRIRFPGWAVSGPLVVEGRGESLFAFGVRRVNETRS